MKVIKYLLLTVLLNLLIVMSFQSLLFAQTSDTIVSVNPTKADPQVNQFFDVTIEVQNVINLSSWQLELFFDPEVIICTNYTVPENNIFGSDIINPPAKVDNAVGRIFAFCAIDANYGVNGSGTLCKIEFQAKIPAISYLDIRNEMSALGTYLMDPANILIPFIAEDGEVKVQDEGFQENVYKGTQNTEEYSIIIYTNATVESFNYNNSKQQIRFLATGPEGSKSLVSTMILSSLLETPYSILLNGSAIYYKALENATHSFLRFEIQHSTIEVIILSTILYDVNGDRIVNMLDLYMVAQVFGATPDNSEWNPLMDVNSDGIINMVDLWTVAIHFGEIWK